MKKKSIWTFVLAVCLIVPMMFMLTACGNKTISEKGKTYSVANKQTDITFNWGSDKDAILEADGFLTEDSAKVPYSTFIIAFDENGGVTISFGGRSDTGKFYVINGNNYIEFYGSKEDAENKEHRLTMEYLGAEYKFSADKKFITVRSQLSDESSVVMKLSANV